jgi:hypothetical protein
MFGIDLRVLRLYMGGVFAIAGLICSCLALWLIHRAFEIEQFRAFSHPRVLLLSAIFPIMAIIYLVASWKIWRERPLAKGWGIVASILLILLPLRQAALRSQPVWSCHGIMLALGIVGLIVFLWPYEERPETNLSESLYADPIESEEQDNPSERH